jgi:HAD superfamily hydrolase (TIGR01509 family)
MIKLIVFDLDGVLVDSVGIHIKTLNEAIMEIAGSEYVPTNEENEFHYNGLKTSDKLKLLIKEKGLPSTYHDEIWNKKQSLTLSQLLRIQKNVIHCNMFEDLKKTGYKIACCSNSIKQSVLIILSNLGILQYFDLILSNEDVKNAKPHPEIYWSAMSFFNVLPEETIIFEDSPQGILSAKRSGSNVVEINSPNEITFEKIIQSIKNIDEKNNSAQSV